MTDGTGTTTYAYDDAGRRTSVRQGLTGIVLSDLYWPGTNRRRSLAGGAQTWTYAYDAGLRPASVGQTLGAATPARYAYHPSGAVARADYGNGTSTYLYYDARGRATNLYHTTGLASNQIVGYRYGADGLMDAMSDTIYGPAASPRTPAGSRRTRTTGRGGWSRSRGRTTTARATTPRRRTPTTPRATARA